MNPTVAPIAPPIPPPAADIYAAIAETARVYKLNHDARVINQRIREENDACFMFFSLMFNEADPHISRTFIRDRAKACFGDVKRLPHRLPDEMKRALDAEADYQTYLRTITPEEWVTRIEALPRHSRNAAANCIWWDYFAERPVTDRWAHLDRYLDNFHGCSDEELRTALLQCGYSEYQADTRIVEY